MLWCVFTFLLVSWKVREIRMDDKERNQTLSLATGSSINQTIMTWYLTENKENEAEN